MLEYFYLKHVITFTLYKDMNMFVYVYIYA